MSERNAHNCSSDILWNNCKVLIDEKPVFYKEWYTSNIVYVSDVLNEHNNFLNFFEFNAKFNLNTPFTTYYGLIDAIPVT